MYYFYLLRCKDNSLYAGITKELKEREKTHNSGKGSTYVRSRKGGKIVYSEKFDNISEALKREREIKKWSKLKKESLISEKLISSISQS